MGSTTASIAAADVMALRSTTGAGLMDCKRALQECGGDLEAARAYLRKQGISVAAKKSGRETREGGIAMQMSDDAQTGALVHIACETDFVARTPVFAALLEGLTAEALQQEALTPEQTLSDGESVQERITAAISELGENIQLVQSRRLKAPSTGGVVGGYVHTNGKVGVLVVLEVLGEASQSVLQDIVRNVAMHTAASQVEAINSDQIDPQLLAQEKDIITAQAAQSGKPTAVIEKMVAGRMAKFIREISLEEQPYVRDPEHTVAQWLGLQAKECGAQLRIAAFAKFAF